MKRLLIAASVALLSSPLAAQTAAEMKEQSMAACKMQSEAMPKEQQAMVLKVCECTVKNTDYDALLAAQSDSAKMQEAQTKAMEIAQKCSTGQAAG